MTSVSSEARMIDNNLNELNKLYNPVELSEFMSSLDDIEKEIAFELFLCFKDFNMLSSEEFPKHKLRLVLRRLQDELIFDDIDVMRNVVEKIMQDCLGYRRWKRENSKESKMISLQRRERQKRKRNEIIFICCCALHLLIRFPDSIGHLQYKNWPKLYSNIVVSHQNKTELNLQDESISKELLVFRNKLAIALALVKPTGNKRLLLLVAQRLERGARLYYSGGSSLPGYDMRENIFSIECHIWQWHTTDRKHDAVIKRKVEITEIKKGEKHDDSSTARGCHSAKKKIKFNRNEQEAIFAMTKLSSSTLEQ